jgi:voltage-gated potassium channel
MNRERSSHAYLLFILALSLFALSVITADTFLHLDPQVHQVLAYTDAFLCALFFVDFCVRLARAERRFRYFIQWGWVDLLSSVPAIHILRFGRAARIVRILRVLRGIRSTKIIAQFILQRRAEGAFLAAALLSILLCTISSIAVLQFETSPEANIKSAEDAIWWSVVTVTTVGYGDRYPLSTEGRVIAALLMAAGVGLFGTFSGFVTAWFLRPTEVQQRSELALLSDEVRKIHELLAVQSAESGKAVTRLPNGTTAWPR